MRRNNDFLGSSVTFLGPMHRHPEGSWDLGSRVVSDPRQDACRLLPSGHVIEKAAVREQLVKHDPFRVEVRAWIELFTHELFRAHILRGAEYAPGHCYRILAIRFGTRMTGTGAYADFLK